MSPVTILSLPFFDILINMENPTLERGIVGAFRLFIAIRLLLWLLLRNNAGVMTGRSVLNAVDIQMFIIISLLDSLVLVVLLWPRLRLRIGQVAFAWLLVLSSAVLFLGHANILALRGFDGLPNATLYTPYSIFFFTTVLFVAWQYDYRAVGFYCGVVTAAQLLILWQFNRLTLELFILNVFISLLTILLPGWLITRLMRQQRQQQAALAAAVAEQARTNRQLVHYAASLEELTISRERNRLARELHDTLAHSLSAVTVQLGAVETLWEHNPATARSLLAQADESARGGLAEARRALQALRASPLEDLGLVLAVATLAKESAARAGATLHLSLPADNLSFLESHVEQSIYRIAQEALENSVRHAQAKQLWVTLTDSAESIHLLIRDDGEGFDPATAAQSGHYGLTGMRERASVIGGTLVIASTQAGVTPSAIGTVIQLTVPRKGGLPFQDGRS